MDFKIKHIEINQSLHGYSDGHRLLESSVQLPKDVERAMLIMSDMSGPSMVSGFESYITGYPLKDGLYAFAKTWYASEMKRPGCVWTHTLLINVSDFLKIINLKVLLKLFKRPRGNNSFPSFASLLHFNANDLQIESDSNYSNYESLSILDALYSYPEKPIFIASNNSEQYENLLIGIWSQQWPKLRSTFYFCTGSIANRKINNRLFDIQVIPFELERQIKREVLNSLFVKINKDNISQNIPSWVSSATNDLYSKTPLRKFLWQLGETNDEGRKAFVKHLKIISLLREIKHKTSSLPIVTKTIYDLYPKSKDATNLKTLLYGEYTKNDDSLFPIADDYNLLKELSTTKYYSSFNSESLNVRERAAKLFKFDKWNTQQLISHIINSELNPLGEEFLSGVAEAIETHDLIDFYQNNPNFLYVFLNLNPSLAISHKLYEYPNLRVNEILDAISKSDKLSKKTIKKIIFTMLDSHINRNSEDLVRTFKEDSVYTFLDWLETSHNRNLHFTDSNYSYSMDLISEWQNTLRHETTSLINWIKKAKKIRVPTLTFLSTILNPNSSEINNLGAKIWLPLTKSNNISMNSRESFRMKAFLLALGLNNPGNGAEKLVSSSFELIYEAANNNLLDYDSWRLVEEQVPSLSWWRNWDKCERLIHGLVEKFIQFNWDIEEFLRATERQDAFRKIINYCIENDKRKEFIQKVAKQVVKGQIFATVKQKNMLSQILEK